MLKMVYHCSFNDVFCILSPWLQFLLCVIKDIYGIIFVCSVLPCCIHFWPSLFPHFTCLLHLLQC